MKPGETVSLQGAPEVTLGQFLPPLLLLFTVMLELSLSPLTPLCAVVNLLCLSSWLDWNVSECLGQTVPTRYSTSRSPSEAT